MAKIYIWGQMDKTGHASISTGHSYESFHPAYGVSDQRLVEGESVPFRWSKFDEDMQHFGGYNREISIFNVNDDDMHRAALALDDDFPKYNLYSANCSNVVASIILAGHDSHYSSNFVDLIFHNHFWHEFKAKMAVHAPFDSRSSHSKVETAMEALENTALAIGRHPVARRHPAFQALASMFALVDLSIRQFVWTPGHVAALAADIG